MKTDLKTTVTAAVGILAFVLARYGVELPEEIQIAIGIVGFAVFAYFAGDKTPRPPKVSTRFVSLVLIIAVTISFTGCSRSQVQITYNASKQIVDKLKINSNIPQVLLDEGVITREVFEKLKKNFDDALILATQFRDDLAAALQTKDPQALANLVPILANLIGTINLLKFEGIERFKKLSKILSQIEGLLRVISVFFSQTITAAESKMSDEEFVNQFGIENPTIQTALFLRELRSVVPKLPQRDVAVILDYASE